MDLLLLLLLLFLAVAFFLGYSSWRPKAKTTSFMPVKSQVIPGPLPLPFIGHLHLLLRGQPHVVLGALAKKYGPVMFLRFGVVPVIVVSSQPWAREFLKANDTAFASRPQFSAGRMLLGYDGEDMVFAPYGQRWKRLRRITVELFTAQALKEVRMSEVRALVASIQDFCSHSPGSSINVSRKLKQLTFNIITRMLVSKRFFANDDAGDAEEAQEFMQLMEETFKLAGAFPISDYLPYSLIRWLNVDQDNRIKALSDANRRFADKLVTEHERKAQEGSAEPPMDFLELLIRRKDDDVLQGNTIKGLMINLLQAATDTTYVSLEWTLAELLNHPLCMSKAQEEISKAVGSNRMVEESDVAQLSYLRAVVSESLRLHPPGALLLPRQSVEPCKVANYDIPKDTLLLVNAYAIGRDASTWKNPLEFEPERFLQSHSDARRNELELLPFGAGTRACPGMSIALSTLHLTLANLLHAFEWSLPTGVHIDTTAEKYGLTVTLANELEAIPQCQTR